MPQKDCNRTFIPDLLAALERQGEPVLEATLKEWLLSLSPAPFGFPFCLWQTACANNKGILYCVGP
ncbi:MAG: hypothetical protein M1389_00870 [Chloroflexi bacterium]|nr:hypothetical protein [Chloroflexota bacterium]